jgi:NADH-quinone oxidoreductase subunit L
VTAVQLWADAGQVTSDHGLWPLLALPLLGALLCAGFGLAGPRLSARLGRLGPGAVAAVGIAAMVATSLIALAAFLRLLALPGEGGCLRDQLFPLLAVDRLHIDLALVLDPLAAVFLLVITLVGTAIHVYAAGYMRGDPGLWRFFSHLNLFVFSMLLLVMSDSLLLCFFGWEGVGLCSYLLIGFWHRDVSNGLAARKAFISNRVGDCGFVTGVLLLVAALGGSLSNTTDGAPSLFDPASPVAIEVRDPARDLGPDRARPPEILPLGPTLSFRALGVMVGAEDARGRAVVAEALAGTRLWGMPLMFLVGLAFFLGMSGKSAQIPLYVWLPDAMAGPTPVSALIHAATMVTAGIYLGARLAFVFALSPGAAGVVALLGLATALLGAVLAIFQQDIKKVLAYSTISQLGYMFLALGVGAPGAAVFHVVTHACFKACLFLAAGSVIHALAESLPGADAAHPDHRPLTEKRRRLGADPADPQDLRNMGGLGPALPRTRLAFLIGSLALAGLPIASGFFSKDEILWRVLNDSLRPLAWPLYLVGLLTAGLTAFYVARTYFLAFAGDKSPAQKRGGHLHEAPAVMTVPVLVLAAASIVVGPWLGWPEAWGAKVPRLEHFLAPVLPAWAGAPRFIGRELQWNLLAQFAAVAVATLGWLGGRAIYRDRDRTLAVRQSLLGRYDALHEALWHRLHIDEFYRGLFVHPVSDFAHAADWFDRHVIDGFVAGVVRVARWAAAAGGWLDRHLVDGVVDGVAFLLLWTGRRLQKVQTGRLNQYTLGIAVGAALLVVVAWLVR